MRILTSLFPLRNIEPSDLNVRIPLKSTKTQRKHSNESMGIQNLKNRRGTLVGRQNLPAIGRIAVTSEIEDNSMPIIHAEQAEQTI